MSRPNWFSMIMSILTINIICAFLAGTLIGYYFDWPWDFIIMLFAVYIIIVAGELFRYYNYGIPLLFAKPIGDLLKIKNENSS